MSTEAHPEPGAVILCGGASSRMGRPKAWLPFGDEVLLQRVVSRIAPVVGPIVVVAAKDQTLPPLPSNVFVTRDRVAEAGPLEGLAVGLEFLKDRCNAAFVATTDAPFLAPALVRRLHVLANGQAAIPWVRGKDHPLTAILPTSAATTARALRDTGEHKVLRLLEAIEWRRVDETELLSDSAVRNADPTLASFTNVNTPEEYELALRAATVGAIPR